MQSVVVSMLDLINVVTMKSEKLKIVAVVKSRTHDLVVHRWALYL